MGTAHPSKCPTSSPTQARTSSPSFSPTPSPTATAEADEEALREFEVALMTPAVLDRDLGPRPEGPSGASWDAARQEFDADRAELLGRAARSLMHLGRTEQALETARSALELDPDASIAREVLEQP